MKKYILLLLYILHIALALTADTSPSFPLEIRAIINAYPDEKIKCSYDSQLKDWRIHIQTDTCAEQILYWAEGRIIPQELLSQKERYRKIIYAYPDETIDPAQLSPEKRLQMVKEDNTGNRRNAPLQHPGLYDCIYDSATRSSIEKNITTVEFLDKHVTVHKKIAEPLARAESKIRRLAQTKENIKNFIDTLQRTDGYLWRDIRDSNSRSLHSFALAIDMLPAGWTNKIVYWYWEKAKGNAEWMLIPLSERWQPPHEVIKIFESEGFIWGGKWGVWDNMHFEYRPELILFSRYKKDYPPRTHGE